MLLRLLLSNACPKKNSSKNRGTLLKLMLQPCLLISTTVSPNNECLEFSDERRRCHAISELSDCELPRYELCHYTCCELRRQASRVTSVTSTTAIDDPCEDYSDSDESCETEIESLADCASRMETCGRSCCLELQKLPTTR